MCGIKMSAFFLAISLLMSFSSAEPQCERINKTIPDLHIHCGYNLTARFNYDKHFHSASRAIHTLKYRLKNCSAFVDLMICSLFLPRCTEDIKGPYLPCRGVCHDYANDCGDIIFREGLEWTAAMCEILPEKDNPRTTKGYQERCFTPPNYKDSGKKYKHNCSDIVIDECKGIPGYTKTVVSPETQRTYQNYLKRTIKYNASDTCSPLRKEIVCAENLPACFEGRVGFLCRNNCLSFFDKCKTPFFYGRDMCMEFPKRERDAPNDLSICKQMHWPRSENWEIAENPSTQATPGLVTTKEHVIKSSSSDKDSISTDTIPSPNPGIRGELKATKKSGSGSEMLLVGLTVSLVLMVLLALAIGGFVWFRRKTRRRQFGYAKQVLYNDDKEEEFQIYT